MIRLSFLSIIIPLKRNLTAVVRFLIELLYHQPMTCLHVSACQASTHPCYTNNVECALQCMASGQQLCLADGKIKALCGGFEWSTKGVQYTPACLCSNSTAQLVKFRGLKFPCTVLMHACMHGLICCFLSVVNFRSDLRHAVGSNT